MQDLLLQQEVEDRLSLFIMKPLLISQIQFIAKSILRQLMGKDI